MTQEQNVIDLAVKLARLADEHPRHIAIDAVDIAGVLLRSGRDYLTKRFIPCDPSPAISHTQESLEGV
jgi:hypothetical protein